jgi:hypothetical protein
MLKNPVFAVVIGSIYLVSYCICLQFESLIPMAWLLLFFCPFLLLWIDYTILRYGKYDFRELNGEEFGYSDREKDQLGVF